MTRKKPKAPAAPLKRFAQVEAPVSSLKMADYNPREMPREQMRSLKRSIREFGYAEPIVARKEDGLIIGGHQRYAATLEILREDKVDPATATVPALFIEGLSDEKTKLLNLALNKISGEWDYDALASLLGGLATLPPEDLQLSGFGLDEVQEILDLLPQTIELQTHEPSINPDDELAAQALRFVFQLATPADADLLRAALKHHGMTNLKANGPAALLALARAGLSVEPELGETGT